MKQPEGKYVLVKDPNKVCSLFSRLSYIVVDLRADAHSIDPCRDTRDPRLYGRSHHLICFQSLLAVFPRLNSADLIAISPGIH